jgi:hypothetical protein
VGVGRGDGCLDSGKWHISKVGGLESKDSSRKAARSRTPPGLPRSRHRPYGYCVRSEVSRLECCKVFRGLANQIADTALTLQEPLSVGV